MGQRAGFRRLFAGITVLLALGVGASAALAAEIDESSIIAPQHVPHQADDGWQAGTCTLDTPPCSVDTPAQFFEQAAGHPPVGFTQFIIKKESKPVIGEIPVGNLKTVLVDLPVGLSVNPQATAQCTLKEGESPSSCPANTQVGTSAVTATNPLTGFSVSIPPVPVYNLVPKPEQPARFGLSILGNDIFLEAEHHLGGRLPRGLHDPRRPTRTRRHPGARSRPDRPEPAGLRRAGGQRHLHHHAEHLLRPRNGGLRTRLLDLSEGRLIRGRRSGFPGGTAVHRVAVAAEKTAARMQHDSVQTVDRGCSRNGSDRLAGRRRGQCRRSVRTEPADAAAVEPAHGQGDFGPGHGLEPLRRQRPPGLHERTVPQGREKSGQRLPGGLEDRHCRDRHAAAAERLAQRQRLPRPAAEPRPDLRAGVPDLRRSGVRSLRHLTRA